MRDRQRKSVGKSKSGRRSPSGSGSGVNRESLSPLHAEIANWLKKVRFRKTVFGADEQDVWKKIAELDEMYSVALQAERAKYEALLERTGGQRRPVRQQPEYEEPQYAEPQYQEPLYEEPRYERQQCEAPQQESDDFFLDDDFLFGDEPENNRPGDRRR